MPTVAPPAPELSRADVVTWLIAHGFLQEAETVRVDALTVQKLAALWFPGQPLTVRPDRQRGDAVELRTPHMVAVIWTGAPDLRWVSVSLRPCLTRLQLAQIVTRPALATPAEVRAALMARLETYLRSSPVTARTHHRHVAVRAALGDLQDIVASLAVPPGGP